MPNTKLTRLSHLIALGTRTKAELTALDAKIQEIVTVGGQPNVIETIKVNGAALPVTDKAVDISIVHPEYSLVKAENSGDYAAIYNLTKDGAVVGASINIPKDLVVKSGSVNAEGNIVLVLNDEANTEIVIDAKSLIEYVTSGSAAGDMVVINVSDDHKVTATITDGTITIAKLESSVQEAIGKAHTHTFDEEVLNGITAAKVAAWDAAEQNAKTYTDNQLKNYSTTDDMNAAIKVVDDKFAAYSTTEQMNAAIKVVDDKFAAYSTTEQMNAAIQVVDNKFANYYTSAQIDAMIASDAEVTAALDEVFGATNA